MSTTNPTVQMSCAQYALVSLANIHDSETNHTRRCDGPAFDELTASVRAKGVLQPVLLRPLAGDAPAAATRFELVCGHRRVAAARAAGLLHVPAVVHELNDLEALEVQLIENLQREDLHPLEEAEGYRTLHEQHGYAIEDLAARVGKSRAYVYARLKLCALQGAARKAFLADQLEASVALLVARIPHSDLQARAVQELLHGARIEIDLDDQDGIGELGGMPPTDYGGLGQPVPYREAAALIQSRYMLRLAGAPFDPKDKGLVPAAGACAECPKRTGNQAELFADVKAADVCTDPRCFAAKKAATLARRRAEAEASGRKILSGKEAEKIFSYEGSVEAAHSSGYVALDQRTTDFSPDYQSKTWRSLVGKHLAEAPTLVQSKGGELIEVVKRTELAAAIKRARLKKRGAGRSGTRDEQDKRARTEARRRTAVRVAATTALVEAFQSKGTPDHLIAVLAWAAAQHAGMDERREAAKRRGMGFSVSGVAGRRDLWSLWRGWVRDRLATPLPGAVKSPAAAKELGGFLLELAIMETGLYGGTGITESMRHAAQLLKVDLKAAQRRALAMLAEKKPAKAAPGAPGLKAAAPGAKPASAARRRKGAGVRPPGRAARKQAKKR